MPVRGGGVAGAGDRECMWVGGLWGRGRSGYGRGVHGSGGHRWWEYGGVGYRVGVGVWGGEYGCDTPVPCGVDGGGGVRVGYVCDEHGGVVDGGEGYGGRGRGHGEQR